MRQSRADAGRVKDQSPTEGSDQLSVKRRRVSRVALESGQGTQFRLMRRLCVALEAQLDPAAPSALRVELRSIAATCRHELGESALVSEIDQAWENEDGEEVPE